MAHSTTFGLTEVEQAKEGCDPLHVILHYPEGYKEIRHLILCYLKDLKEHSEMMT